MGGGAVWVVGWEAVPCARAMPLETEQAKTAAAIHNVRFIGDSPCMCV
jgi:hypothetical protein